MTINQEGVRVKSLIEFILITCCTYNRPLALDKLLNSLLKLNYPANIKVEILIVDNDKKETAKNIVNKYQKISDIKINYVTEEHLGLASVRNKALQEAIELNASHIAFIDDDEIADSNWLVEHINFYNNNENIYVSSGPTYAYFEKEYPKYITESNVFKRTTTKKQGQIRKNCATGNVFFPLNLIIENNLKFSERYNFLGGEDGDFFNKITELGFDIGWNNKAINYEVINDERANVIWIIKRKFYNGYSGSLVKFGNKENLLKRIFYIVEKTVTVILNAILSIVSVLFGRSHFFNCIGLMVINLGKLMGALFLKPINYYQKREVQND